MPKAKTPALTRARGPPSIANRTRSATVEKTQLSGKTEKKSWLAERPKTSAQGKAAVRGQARSPEEREEGGDAESARRAAHEDRRQPPRLLGAQGAQHRFRRDPQRIEEQDEQRMVLRAVVGTGEAGEVDDAAGNVRVEELVEVGEGAGRLPLKGDAASRVEREEAEEEDERRPEVRPRGAPAHAERVYTQVSVPPPAGDPHGEDRFQDKRRVARSLGPDPCPARLRRQRPFVTQPFAIPHHGRLRGGAGRARHARPRLPARSRRPAHSRRPAGTPGRPRAPPRGGAGRTDPRRSRGPARRGPLSRHLVPDQLRRRARAARPRPPPAVRDQPQILRELHRHERRHEHLGVPRHLRRRRGPRQRAAASLRRSALRQPQRRRPGLRQRRVPLHRPRRRRVRGRPVPQRPEPRDAPRQDAADRRGPRLAIRGADRQSLRLHRRRLPRDLGLRAAQPLALRLRSRYRGPVHRRRGPEPPRGDRRRPRLPPRRRELRLERDGGVPLLSRRQQLQPGAPTSPPSSTTATTRAAR